MHRLTQLSQSKSSGLTCCTLVLKTLAHSLGVTHKLIEQMQRLLEIRSLCLVQVAHLLNQFQLSFLLQGMDVANVVTRSCREMRVNEQINEWDSWLARARQPRQLRLKQHL